MNWPLLQNSLLVAGMTTALAAGFGLVAALWLATLEARWRNGVLALAVVALALPPFLVTNCWISLLGDNGALRAWLPLRIYSLGGTIWILSLMLWPITLFAALAGWRRLEAAQFECDPAMRGFALLRWLLLPVARGELALAAVVTFVLALNNFAVPAILQTKVLPDEMWVRFNTQFDTQGALRTGLPLVIAPMLLLALFWRREIAWPRLQGSVPAKIFHRQLGSVWCWAGGVFSVALCILSVGLPLGQIALANRTWTELPGALAAGQGAVWSSFWLAALAASVIVSLALAASAGLFQRRGAEDAERRRGNNQLRVVSASSAPLRFILLWLPFLVPGVLLGIGLIGLFNRPPFLSFYRSAGIVVLSFVVRYVALGLTGTRKALQTVDSDLTDAARLEGASRWQMLRFVQWPQIAPQVLAAWYVVYLLCLWDVESMILVVPPGGETLALRIFNLLHYGHNAQVNALCVALLGLAVAPLGIWLMWERARVAGCVLRVAGMPACVAVLFSGCSQASDLHENMIESRFFERAIVIGSRGAGVGEFNKPRSVAVDSADNVYAVDMTGRVQKFSPEGKFLLSWQMPQTDLGKPKGMGRDHKGNIVVIEPHYQRVNHFTPEGKLVAQWGCRGTNEGCFMLPRGIAENSSGEFFVCEYMGAERVQRFAPPVWSLKSGALSQENGGTSPLTPALSPSEGEREENRQAVARTGGVGNVVGRTSLSPLPRGGGEGQGEGAGTQAEHLTSKIQHPTPKGVPLTPALSPSAGGRGNTNWPYAKSDAPLGSPALKCAGSETGAPILLGVLGRPGTGPGEFNRAEGICVDAQDRVYVADSCNHRIQIFSRDGKFLREYGKAGTGFGELSYPYDIAVDGRGYQFVCEFGNSRIQVFDINCQPVEIIGGAGAGPGKFNNPWGVALDSHGNLYVADALNHRVQKLVRKMGPVGLRRPLRAVADNNSSRNTQHATR